MKNAVSGDKSSTDVIKDLNLNQYVTFAIGEEFYGIEVLKVQEIIGMTKITHIPNAVTYMKGMINLRGIVVPVIDMRLKFKMPERQYDEFTVILIIEVNESQIGMIVDTVSDVINLPDGNMQETPHFNATIDSDYIVGIGNLDNQLIIILDSDKILSGEDLKAITSGTEERAAAV